MKPPQFLCPHVRVVLATRGGNVMTNQNTECIFCYSVYDNALGGRVEKTVRKLACFAKFVF